MAARPAGRAPRSMDLVSCAIREPTVENVPAWALQAVSIGLPQTAYPFIHVLQAFSNDKS